MTNLPKKTTTDYRSLVGEFLEKWVYKKTKDKWLATAAYIFGYVGSDVAVRRFEAWLNEQLSQPRQAPIIAGNRFIPFTPYFKPVGQITSYTG